NAGTLGGTGTINVGAGNALTSSGTLNPGNSPGTLNVTGNLVLTSSSVTNFEIQGTLTPGTDFDVINVSGAATIAGTANIVHLGTFSPSVGNTFQVINATGGLSGTFGTVSTPAGATYNTSYNTGATPPNVTFQNSVSMPVLNWNTDGSGNWNTAANWT